MNTTRFARYFALPVKAHRPRRRHAEAGIGATDGKLLQAHAKADHHNPSSPDTALSSATSFRSV